MIHGVGADIVQIERVRRALARHGEAFAARILAPVELDGWRAIRDPGRFLAKHFAAKEAFGKALGIGVSPPATLHALNVVHDTLGKPVLSFDERLAAHMVENSLSAHLSLSDEHEYAVAFVVIERP